jgi:type I restriction enzyme S subunit
MSEVNLPEEWCIPSFNDAVLNVNGARKPVSLKVRESIKGQFPYYGATGQIDSLNDFTHEGEHILIGEDGANLLSKSKDLAFIVDGQFWVNNHAHAIKCLAGVPTKFIANYINSLDLTPWVTGSAQPKLTKGNLEKIPTPLPPLAEQKVIAAKLDTLLAQVETTKARLDRIPEILKTFRQSVLAAAVSGKLTEEWRGSPSLDTNQPSMSIGSESKVAPTGWSWRKLTDLALLESGHTPRKSVIEYWENGDVYWLSLQDIREVHGKVIKDTKFKPTMLGIENSSARLLPEGTVCFCRDISVGYVTIMGKSMSTTQHFANWICGDYLNNKFLMCSFMAAKDHLLISGQGTTVKTIYMPALKELRILVPSVKEQTEIVRRVEELFAFADSIEQKTNTALERVNNLTQSILAKAFRGELTADWRSENPDLISGENSAEALLAKIQAEREKLALEKKAAKKPRKKT